jgi:hypothetical protein
LRYFFSVSSKLFSVRELLAAELVNNLYFLDAIRKGGAEIVPPIVVKRSGLASHGESPARPLAAILGDRYTIQAFSPRSRRRNCSKTASIPLLAISITKTKVFSPDGERAGYDRRRDVVSAENWNRRKIDRKNTAPIRREDMPCKNMTPPPLMLK